MQRLLLLSVLAGCAAGQVRNYTPVDLPSLEKFDVSWIDKSKDPCTDFYQYTCSKWIAAHPIPADMASTSVALPVFLYNQTILRNAMEKAAADNQATGQRAADRRLLAELHGRERAQRERQGMAATASEHHRRHEIEEGSGAGAGVSAPEFSGGVGGRRQFHEIAACSVSAPRRIWRMPRK